MNNFSKKLALSALLFSVCSHAMDSDDERGAQHRGRRTVRQVLDNTLDAVSPSANTIYYAKLAALVAVAATAFDLFKTESVVNPDTSARWNDLGQATNLSEFFVAVKKLYQQKIRGQRKQTKDKVVVTDGKKLEVEPGPKCEATGVAGRIHAQIPAFEDMGKLMGFLYVLRHFSENFRGFVKYQDPIAHHARRA